MWDSVKSILGKSAPVLGAALSGPAGAAVGLMISNVLGVSTEEEVLEKLKNDPEALLKLKELEITHRTELEKINLSAYTSTLKDIQDARNKNNGHWMPSILTLVLAVMVSGMFVALFLIPPSEAYAQVLIMIAGTILGAFSTAVAFWLGSSQGSWEKQRQILGNQK